MSNMHQLWHCDFKLGLLFRPQWVGLGPEWKSYCRLAGDSTVSLCPIWVEADASFDCKIGACVPKVNGELSNRQGVGAARRTHLFVPRTTAAIAPPPFR